MRAEIAAAGETGDVAILLDVALGEDEIALRVEPGDDDAGERLGFFVRALQALVPAGFGYVTLGSTAYVRPARLADPVRAAPLGRHAPDG